ncbi:KGGVGR-motif variant AAA ATPase [Pseudoduganella sp. S-14]|uniref:KGGVGR-motif variant AAA ATPase n=1 Tax=Pseudoduganella sp. S-14 TaxID=3404065 RepID=UPI003CFAA24B
MEHLRLHLPELPAAGEVTTFYSYKGGVGRTMALANLGHILASRRTAPVLLVDWDLEAPGLHYYFPGAADAPGVLDLFEECREQLQQRAGRYASEQALAEAVFDAVRWEQYLIRACDDRPLWLLRAGRCDGSHAERAAMLDWQGLFDACPALFRTFAARLARHFGHVLVDARSGRADCAAICTTLLPTRLVLVFAPNRQNLDGLQDLVARATGYRSCHEDEQRQLLVYPLPSRIDTSDEAQCRFWRRGEDGAGGYQRLFEGMLGQAYGLPWLSLEDYFDAVQLPHCASLASGEPLPALALQQGYYAFMQWFGDGLCPWQRLPAAGPATLNNHHVLPLEQDRAGYWPMPAAM